MNKRLKSSLAKKGWSKQEIKKTEHIIKKSRVEKTKKNIFLDNGIYLVALFISIIGNLVMSVALIPFLMTMEKLQLYLVIIVLGGSFGLFFEIIIRDIENLQKKHHVVAGMVIPFLALVNMYIITEAVEKLDFTIGIKNITHIPLLVGFVYAVSFISPYVFYQLVLKKK